MNKWNDSINNSHWECRQIKFKISEKRSFYQNVFAVLSTGFSSNEYFKGRGIGKRKEVKLDVCKNKEMEKCQIWNFDMT